jgi:hypothetical protein
MRHTFRLPQSLVILAGSCAAPALAQPLCGEWQRFATPNPGSDSNLLIDVAFASRDEGIAVGNWSGGGLSRRPTIQHWDGSAWTGLSLPETSHLGTLPSIEGTGLAGSEVWVVGSVITPYPTDHMPLVFRWRDGGWDSLTTPTLRPQNTYPFAARGGFANDVTGVAADDIWVVGTATGYGDASATSVALALHHDGSAWTDVPVPIAGNRTNNLDCVSASSPDNVWAVGEWRNLGGQYQALIVRWDGSTWHRVPNPGEGAGGGDAEAVVALAGDDVWVSGSFNNGADRLIHWNGSSWDVVNAGLPGPFAAFAPNAPDDIWASCAINATFYHFDGSEWTPAASPAIPGSTYVLRGWGMAAVGPCDVRAVGGWSDGVTQRTLAEHLTPRRCLPDFNGDGQADFFDYLDFAQAFDAEDPSADFNADGQIDFFDYLDFIQAFDAGCS